MLKSGEDFDNLFLNSTYNKGGYINVIDFEKIVKGLKYNIQDIYKSLAVIFIFF